MSSDVIRTTPTDAVEEDPLLLYEPLHEQVDGKKVPWKIKYSMVTPQQAQTWLEAADNYSGFYQRKRTPARVTRWLKLYETNRFAFFNPFAALGFNEDGIVMNGGNRLGALAKFSDPVGFMVVENCPTWMLNYIDNGVNRSAREAMHINKKDVRPDTQNTTRLGMRYEEFLFGKRGEYGWVDWSKQRDEHVDLINWQDKRQDLLDNIPRAKKINKVTDIPVASLTCFLTYQESAWPDDKGMLNQFLDGLEYGVMLDKGHPALTLREWATQDGFIGGYSRGRREGHLLLLFKFFTLFAEGHKANEVRVAKGLPMAMPYHPSGWEVACKNVRTALVEME